MWRKLGRVICPEKLNYPWINSHAMDPTVSHIKDDIYREFITVDEILKINLLLGTLSST